MTGDGRIFPRNLTARAAHRVDGNPDMSRPEDVVGNCFPGLDMDVRNLDRRFFPGLVFEFVWDQDLWQGARLLYCDALGDPDLQPAYLDQIADAPHAGDVGDRQQRLLAKLVDLRQTLSSAPETLQPGAGESELQALAEDGIWFLHSVEQDGKEILLSGPSTEDQKHGEVYFEPLSGEIVWRIVRSLQPGLLTIRICRRHLVAHQGQAAVVLTHMQVLDGWRRWYTGPETGVLSGAYLPGELTMSLCSPWQHDFRDCACHYWASNRPDVVFGAVAPEESTLPGGEAKDPQRATTRLDWMRSDRAAEAAALRTMFANRPFQMDHFELSQRWQELNIVLRNTEIGDVYQPPPPDPGLPYDSPEELYGVLHGKLAGLEMTLALEYLYASFSLIPEDGPPVSGWPSAREHAAMARHALRLTAISEMEHLRWVNELLWSLADAFFPKQYKPALEPCLILPVPPLVQGHARRHRRRALRPLTLDVLAEFVAVEQPSGGIDGVYARVIATLAQDGYPPSLHQLASRIANDGMQHFSRFAALRETLEPYGDVNPAYLLPRFQPGAPHDQGVGVALATYQTLIGKLGGAYAALAGKNYALGGTLIAQARADMQAFLASADALASRNLGVPFW